MMSRLAFFGVRHDNVEINLMNDEVAGIANLWAYMVSFLIQVLLTDY